MTNEEKSARILRAAYAVLFDKQTIPADAIAAELDRIDRDERFDAEKVDDIDEIIDKAMPLPITDSALVQEVRQAIACANLVSGNCFSHQIKVKAAIESSSRLCDECAGMIARGLKAETAVHDLSKANDELRMQLAGHKETIVGFEEQIEAVRKYTGVQHHSLMDTVRHYGERMTRKGHAEVKDDIPCL